MAETPKKLTAAEANAIGYSSLFQIGAQIASTYFTYQNAKNEKAILKCQAELYRIQAQSRRNAADDAMRAGNQHIAAITFQAGQQKAATRVSMAASGVQVGVGSSAEILASQDIARDMQVNQTYANAVTASFGYRRAATNTEGRALATQAASNSISPWAAATIYGLKSLGKDQETGDVGLDNWNTAYNFLSEKFKTTDKVKDA